MITFIYNYVKKKLIFIWFKYFSQSQYLHGKFSIISHGTGKYGRVLGELFVKGHESSVNQLLIENGHAYEYDGGKKKVFGG